MAAIRSWSLSRRLIVSLTVGLGALFLERRQRIEERAILFTQLLRCAARLRRRQCRGDGLDAFGNAGGYYFLNEV